ncbi:MAG: hypothetical protein K0U39_04095 [Alphaproteobacteria bacterium]|nr:hypothetical protein [Alphaproteobacteria bacterium]
MRFLQKKLFIFTNSVILFISYVILSNILPIISPHDAFADIQRNPDNLSAKYSVTSPQKNQHLPIIPDNNVQTLFMPHNKK